MGSTLSVSQLQGLTSGNDANVVKVPSGHTLYAPGHVIQVVQGVKTDTFSTTTGANTTYITVTGLSASITPKYSTSKIMVFLDLKASNSSGAVVHARLMRDTTAVGIGDASGSRPRSSTAQYYDQGDTRNNYALVAMHLDSPATTNQLTYSVQIAGDGTGYALNVNTATRKSTTVDSLSQSSITLMEIAA